MNFCVHGPPCGLDGADGVIGVHHQRVALWVGGTEAIVGIASLDGARVCTRCIEQSPRLIDVIDDQIERAVGLVALLEDEVRASSKFEDRCPAHIHDEAHADRRVEVDDPPSESRPPEIDKPPLEGAQLAAAEALYADIKGKSADPATLVAELFSRMKHPKSDPNLQLLLGRDHSSENKLKLAMDILAFGQIPSRIVHGVRLSGYQRQTTIVHWLQIFDKGLWRSHDPETGNPAIPGNYFTWWRGLQPLMDIDGGDRLSMTMTIAPNQEEAIRAAMYHTQLTTPKLLEFSLFSLPLEAQAVYRILLMVPMGALLLLVLRNVIGVKTFGTFMPILMALAFRETQLVWGIVLFSLVVALGLGVRFYLEHLKLLLVPRLASLLIIVIILMAILSILSHKLGLERGLSVALFPMVILTMTIERMCIVWEERGASESIQQGLGSLAVASLTYLAMSIPHMEHVLFVFPELLLLCLAGTLLMGRYTGFRLLELRRFKALTQ